MIGLFGRFQRPAAWVLLVAGLVTFVSVLASIVTVGDAKLATLLVSADLFVSGVGVTQEALNEEDTSQDMSRGPIRGRG